MTPENAVLLVGTGAQINSWNPVVRALRRVAWSHLESGDEANLVLAHIVQVRRLFAGAIGYQRTHGRVEGSAPVAGLQEASAAYVRVCQAIREELSLAEDPADPDHIRLRPQFNAVWDAVIGNAHRVMLLTTNWDRTLARESSRRWPGVGDEAVLHLHGDRRDGLGFLLPSETTFEPYREEAEIRHLDRRRLDIINVLEKADRLVIYGLSLAPLDAELAHVLAHGLEIGRVGRVDIVDPGHRGVARRLQALIPARRISVFGRDPGQLEVVHDWTL